MGFRTLLRGDSYGEVIRFLLLVVVGCAIAITFFRPRPSSVAERGVAALVRIEKTESTRELRDSVVSAALEQVPILRADVDTIKTKVRQLEIRERGENRGRAR